MDERNIRNLMALIERLKDDTPDDYIFIVETEWLARCLDDAGVIAPPPEEPDAHR